MGKRKVNLGDSGSKKEKREKCGVEKNAEHHDFVLIRLYSKEVILIRTLEKLVGLFNVNL